MELHDIRVDVFLFYSTFIVGFLWGFIVNGEVIKKMERTIQDDN